MVTWKWFLSCMYPNMSFHICSRSQNDLNTKRALVFPCSKPNWFNLQNKQTKKVERKFFILLLIFRNSMNFSNMWLTIARGGKSSWAVVTWKWFLPSMYPNMLFHITLIFHNLNAKRTLVLSCSKSNWFNLQNKQTRIFFEKVNPLFSQIVSIFLKFMMLSNMCITIASLCKSFRTIWTFERFFPCMC